jgi:saccharopine dehydrogenase-like NADP-dependent oxidoreductase
MMRKAPHKFHIDLLATAMGLLGNLGQDSQKVGRKKKKLLTGHVGFDPGFTLVYSRYLVSMAKRKKDSKGRRQRP